MPLFLIRRDVTGATQTDYDAGVFRAISCAYDYEGLRWIHSYWDREGGMSYCLYEARSIDQIKQHSQRSQIACDEVLPVSHVQPEMYTAGRLSQAEAPTP
jgi:hypothetical protein